MGQLSIAGWASNFVVGFAAFLASSCQQQEGGRTPSGTTASPEPYWHATPSLPAEPQGFCEAASAIMHSQFDATDIKCTASPAAGYGVRGKRQGSEVVVLLGANKEWFAFAYLAESEKSPARLSDKALGGLVASLEGAFRGQR